MCSRRVGDKHKICFGPNWAYHKITYDLIGSFKKKKRSAWTLPTNHEKPYCIWPIQHAYVMNSCKNVRFRGVTGPSKKEVIWIDPFKRIDHEIPGEGGRILQDFSEPLEGKKQQQPGRSLRSYILPWKLPIESNHETYREPITIFQVRVVK